MAIKSIQELEFKKTLTALIYGQKGAGKTTLALSSDPNSLLIDTDNGVDRVQVEHLLTSKFIQVTTYAELMRDLEEGAKSFSTIIVDTMGKLIDIMIEHTRSENPKYCNPQGGLSMQGWGVLNNTFKTFCRSVRLMNKNLIFVAHESIEKNGDINRKIPDVRANNYSLFATEVDLIGYIECVGIERTISFNPTDTHDGKNTGGFDHIIKIPQLKAGQNNNFFYENIVKKHFENVNNKEKVKEQIADKFKEIELLIDAIHSASGANIFTEEIKKIEHIGTSLEYAKTKFTAKTRELNLKFNKSIGLYEMENSNEQ